MSRGGKDAGPVAAAARAPPSSHPSAVLEEAFPALHSAVPPSAPPAGEGVVTGKPRTSYADLLLRRANHLRAQQQQQEVPPQPPEQEAEEHGQEEETSASPLRLVKLGPSSFFAGAAAAAAAAAAVVAGAGGTGGGLHEEEGPEAEPEDWEGDGGPAAGADAKPPAAVADQPAGADDPGRRLLLMAQAAKQFARRMRARVAAEFSRRAQEQRREALEGRLMALEDARARRIRRWVVVGGYSGVLLLF